MVYRTNVPSCHRTCANVHTEMHESCYAMRDNWCTCPEGKYLQGDTCVFASECVCHKNGRTYNNGEKAKENCNEWFVLFLLYILFYQISI
ncbi:hypothetical protein DPMN_179196 [Dreissena polymorpha]|uniref:Uncharacterized protein n=1 Tax=Dreissena polymorpha TaxID=45954 RepID=A0A9D4EEA9_DREPO|nr:hypothetical protein DPMN_179196 [Dreissena polymorpha]